MKIDLKSAVIKNKKMILYIAAFICVIAAVVFSLQIRQKQGEIFQNSPAENPPAVQPESEAPAKAAGSEKSSAQSKAQPALTYGEMVNKYAGYRIQFTENCQVVPNNVTYKNGTEVMFDNRASKKLAIALADEIYYFEPYSYKILPLYAKKLPFTIRIDCGTGKNNGTILLQQ